MIGQRPAAEDGQVLLPDWEELLHSGIQAARQLGEHTASALEPAMLNAGTGAEHQRPLVFSPAFMSKWLDTDEAAACYSLRTAGGFGRFPDTRAEAARFLGVSGCRSHGSQHWIKYPLAAHEEDLGIWEVTCCCDCGHPFLRYFAADASKTVQWSLYADLP
ncbi:hypothetical protein [Nocardia ninae]|uniref:Uncharacterized protein n=1 Tax=Nocardia ninae NBRC 108245 TaxID=1210091 RepID=A0A511MNG8_9NOCA|nr:hypothetical protein [Nocardia ninae]GEM42155.1 hypothetical protein NN4_66740 [Nocardia ninae NBRC 108245]